MAVRILPRSTWTSTSPGGSPIDWSRVRGLVAHYPAMGGDVGVISQSREIHYLQGWRNYHVYSLGWSDIGYCYAIGQSGRIYKLRGDRTGGHTYGHNSTTLGVLFIVGDSEPLTAAAKASFRSLRATLRHRGASSGVWGHREMSGNSTRCPGPYIMADIRSGELTGASAPSRPSTPGLSDGLADVDDSQRWLTELGYGPGPIDGVFGPRTETATRAFQTDFDITPADGRPGPATRAILEDAMTKLDDIARKLDDLPREVMHISVPNRGRFSGDTNLAKKVAWQADLFAQTHEQIAALSGELAGVLAALRAIDAGEPLDLDQVRAAARDGVDQALDSLEVTVSQGE